MGRHPGRPTSLAQGDGLGMDRGVILNSSSGCRKDRTCRNHNDTCLKPGGVRESRPFPLGAAARPLDQRQRPRRARRVHFPAPAPGRLCQLPCRPAPAASQHQPAGERAKARPWNPQLLVLPAVFKHQRLRVYSPRPGRPCRAHTTPASVPTTLLPGTVPARLLLRRTLAIFPSPDEHHPLALRPNLCPSPHDSGLSLGL